MDQTLRTLMRFKIQQELPLRHLMRLTSNLLISDILCEHLRVLIFPTSYNVRCFRAALPLSLVYLWFELIILSLTFVSGLK
jgi:hypothetical protein